MHEFLTRSYRAPLSAALRLFRAQWRQSALNPECPQEPSLAGKRAFVTGGSGGIGLEICRGLLARGATVVATGSTTDSASRAQGVLSATGPSHPQFVALNLADLASISKILGSLSSAPDSTPFDVLILNAGVWPQRHALSAQGYEIAFATNVLGHFALVTKMLKENLLAPSARVVVVTGDIYILADACSSNFTYRGMWGGTIAYCRSKLGNLWLADELQRRYTGLQVIKVHPGVVASNLFQAGGALGRWFKRAFFISARDGAQTPLIAATQPGLIPGAYLHNTCGEMLLGGRDPATHYANAAALWSELTRIVESHAL